MLGNFEDLKLIVGQLRGQKGVQKEEVSQCFLGKFLFLGMCGKVKL